MTRLGTFASKTSVPVARSRVEIERVLIRYGVTKFGTMTEETRVTIYFETKGRQIQWAIPIPPQAKYRHETDHAQEVRRRWLVLVITVKALLEAVESKLLTFDQAFLSHLVIPGSGKTLGEAIVPKLDALYAGQSLPKLLAENPSP